MQESLSFVQGNTRVIYKQRDKAKGKNKLKCDFKSNTREQEEEGNF